MALFGEPEEGREDYCPYIVAGQEKMVCLIHPDAMDHMLSLGADEEGDFFFYNEMAGRLRIRFGNDE